jgi:hypothetical protein
VPAQNTHFSFTVPYHHYYYRHHRRRHNHYHHHHHQQHQHNNHQLKGNKMDRACSSMQMKRNPHIFSFAKLKERDSQGDVRTEG